ncbi:RhuM family protein [Arcobacter venerupis]|uniref:RhuM family protein n=1 Tax=Arcobacter venerupis TaxID=1054033 RepID=A0AAE7B9P6_9BACT|nr:RhuM family protein [Arcobacter venerupis]QKF67711.1 RhuM family protein [Arcobacter venerupis]RWS49133.1 DNA-binding protein [Arcobacter venerupis]
MNNISNIVVYNDGELELKVSVNEETIWLTQKQISEVFGVNIPAISKHIKNIYKDNELNQFSTVSILEIVQKEGDRDVLRNVEHYNLDIILAVGYRTNSVKAIKFRQWATTILKNYIQNAYVINSDKITNERFVSLEKDVNILKNKIDNISVKFEDNSLKIKEGIFFDGQVYDAYSFVSDLIKKAKDEIILIDNYIDDTTLTLFSKTPHIKVTIFTNTISKQLKLDFEKYSKQYDNITLKNFQNAHDRFLIIDKKEIFHIGASIKDLGKRWFAFSKINLDIDELIKKLN